MPSGDASVDGATFGDAAVDATTSSDGSVVGQCAADAGPAMIAVGSFCIDATEVTNGQYADFINAKKSDTSGQPSYCAWNVDYTPSCLFPNSDANLPVACVDWCDAYAYCAWAGKHLCGGVDGGPAPRPSFATVGVNAWYTACSHSGERTYPYGSSYDSTACNGGDLGKGGNVDVGSLSKCEGGYPGIFDMSGNVNEWTDSCDSYDGGTDGCQIRGGSWEGVTSTAAAIMCGATGGLERQDTAMDNGFRCCSP